MLALWNTLTSWWPWANGKEFLTSEFFAGLIGAGVGATAAYIFSARSELRVRRLQEIARANAAIALAHGIVNAAATMKKQHTAELVASYRNERAKAEQALATRRGGVIEVNMNLMTLAQPYMPGADLQNTVADGVLLSPRSQIIAIQLRQVVETLKATIGGRNELCLSFKTMPDNEKLPTYLGFPQPNGTDQRLPMLMEALEKNVDDCMYFGLLLQEILQNHIRRIRRKMWWRAPRPLRFDYSILGNALPDTSQYPDFEENFRKKESLLEKLRRAPGRWWTGV